MSSHRYACCFAFGLLSILITGCGRTTPTDSAPAALPASMQSAAIDGEAEWTVAGEGTGPGKRGDQYDRIVDNPFRRVEEQPQSTFSIDVDTASYSKVRQFLLEHNQLPRPDAVRIEELLNYFTYAYSPPAADESHPFAVHSAVTRCPWNPSHRLVRLALKGRELQLDQRPNSNLVLLIDTSGSMDEPNKLPLLQRSMRLLLEQLNAKDRIAMVTYAGSAGLVLDSTPADQSKEILAAMNRLSAGGSTNGGQGLELAYAVARDHFIPGGTNRVLLCTDGDFNVGMTGTDQMVRFIEEQSKGGVELSVLGFGMGNLNDAMLEQISGRGNGNYAFIDTFNEAKKVLAEQLAGTLVTIAKDVKIQVEFNPNHVAAYRLIGYENRILENADFNDDKKDAGEIGAGHAVTALYEIVPADTTLPGSITQTDPLKYQSEREVSTAADSDELLTIKLRYKLPEQTESQLIEHVVQDSDQDFAQADNELRFAAAVAGFGMLLRNSEHKGEWNYDAVLQTAKDSLDTDPHGFRKEFLELVSVASSLTQ